MALQPIRRNCSKPKPVLSCCKRFHKPCLDVWMSSPCNSLPSPPVVCVRVSLPFVLQNIFTKAVISKLPFIKAKQANTNTRKQRGSEPYPGSRRRSRDGRAEEPQLPWQGPCQASLQLRCHPFYKPHGYTQLCVSLGMAIQSACF